MMVYVFVKHSNIFLNLHIQHFAAVYLRRLDLKSKKTLEETLLIYPHIILILQHPKPDPRPAT